MCSELHIKIGKRKETVGVVETLLVFPVAAFHLAVVPGRVGTDPLVPNPKPCCGQFKTCEPVFPVGREAVGKRNAVVCLRTLYPYTTALEPGRHFLQEIGGRVGALLRVS